MDNPVDIGSRLELFVDELLVASQRGTAFKLHTPALAPQSASPLKAGYFTTIIKDGGRYRAYYREYDRTYAAEQFDGNVGEMTCYAESEDGITWTKPSLNIFKFDGDGRNNIVWDFHGACMFKDENESDPNQRYKAIGFCRRYRNIFLLTSPDGIRWDDSQWLEPVLHRLHEGMTREIAHGWAQQHGRPLPTQVVERARRENGIKEIVIIQRVAPNGDIEHQVQNFMRRNLLKKP